MDDKYVYKKEGEFSLISSQCEACIFYNKGKYSDECPQEQLEEIKKNRIGCPKKKIKSIFD